MLRAAALALVVTLALGCSDQPATDVSPPALPGDQSHHARPGETTIPPTSVPPNAPAQPVSHEPTTYVGSARCATCHAAQSAAWSPSSHARAMSTGSSPERQAKFDVPPTSFGDAAAPEQAKFSPARQDSSNVGTKHAIGTGGATGTLPAVEMIPSTKPASASGEMDASDPEALARLLQPGAAAAKKGAPRGPLPIPYILGHAHIEQPLVATEDGHLQALPVGFDVVKGEWFDLFPGDPRTAEDWGHWSGRGMNANTQCLICHTTGFTRGYDAASDSFKTTWAEPSVGCEACHGPGSAHVSAREFAASAAADATATAPPPDPYRHQSPSRRLDSCAVCHSLRRELVTGFVPGQAFLDSFEPILLDGDEYHPDGQVRAESYEWTAFASSRMAERGVTCTDCHDPHGGRVRADGDALCLGCHQPQLASRSHTHHAPESAGARCIACHMPEKTFMGRDVRHDHSFSIPDPQAATDASVPNACTSCHGDQPASWAEARLAQWFPRSERRAAHRERMRMFAAGRAGDPAAMTALAECARGGCTDPIRRASATRLLARYPGEAEGIGAIVAASKDSDPIVRAGAAWALTEIIDGPDRPESYAALRTVDGAWPHLERGAADPVRAVRLNAAFGLRHLPPTEMTETSRRALTEWSKAMESQSDHPEAHHTLGVYYADRGDTGRAEAAYRKAIELEPNDAPSRYGLAMLMAQRGDAAGAEKQLLSARSLAPRDPAILFALGMVFGEQENWERAVATLKECVKIDPLFPGGLANLAQAYVKLGAADDARKILEAALEYPGAQAEAMRSLVAIHLETGDRATARTWAQRAVTEDPELALEPRVKELLGQQP